ncbi:MAG: cell division protein FtsQ/DivIB [Rhodoferax sp.]|jgi:cell division protein FtsQ|nr:cell division protein FtsQ/DivIB [Rhodoferax sp.]
MSEAIATPFDVRLMNITASVLFLVFGVLALGALAGWVGNHALFAIRAITVQGDVSHNNAVTLRANVLPRLGGSFFTLDLAQARESFQAVPWIRQAVVRREFPNRLKVILQEHQAVAYWGAEGDSRLLNSFGEVFEANTGEVEHELLPRLVGPTGQEPEVLAMYRALQPLFGDLDMAVDQLELTGRGSWVARLDTGAEVELGRGTQPEVLARTNRFLRTLTQVTARYNRRPDAVESADLRHPDGYALRLRGVSTVVGSEPKK